MFALRKFKMFLFHITTRSLIYSTFYRHVDGHLYELDGRKAFPINHGATTPSTLLVDACTVIKQFMDRDPGEMRFTIVALGAIALDD